MKKKFIVRRSVSYSGGRKASSYLIEGSMGYRFAKCGVCDALTLREDCAKKILSNLRRRDIHRGEATYAVLPA